MLEQLEPGVNRLKGRRTLAHLAVGDRLGAERSFTDPSVTDPFEVRGMVKGLPLAPVIIEYASRAGTAKPHRPPIFWRLGRRHHRQALLACADQGHARAAGAL